MSGKKTVLITGASRGIGAAAAREFARAGWAVAVNYCRSGDRAQALVDGLRREGHTALAVRADVSDREQVRSMVDNVLENFCQLDTLVCNAGVGLTGMFCDMTQEQWRRLFAVNVEGVIHCVQAVLPHMVHRKWGRIVTLSSMWGVTGGSCEAGYSATKGAVIALTRALAKELGPSGITVNCVAPGVIDTEMNANLGPEDLAALSDETPLGRVGTPEEVARAVLFLAGEGGDFITGQVLQPNGGLVI